MTRKILNLNELIIRNFKGIKDLRVVAEGEDLKIFGDNEAGKTTIFDAFTYLLFGKDSKNQSKFEIKTLDRETGEVLQHGVNHEVEGKFTINDSEVSLKRIYKESWTKKKGSSKSTFTGHSTEYQIDGVPSRKKDFEDRVSTIINEDIFKLLTSPTYFNQLNWKDRREILIDIAGEVKDKEVAEKSTDLQDFISNLNGRSVEDKVKIVKARQKEVNKELETIPTRIDEINHSLPEIMDLDQREINGQISVYDQQIADRQEKKADIQNGAEVNNRRKQLSEVELEMGRIKNEHEQEDREKFYKIKASVQENESNVGLLTNKLDAHKGTLDLNEKKIAQLEEEKEELRDQWRQKNKEQFEHKEDCTCPTCGQDLPEEKVEESRKKAEEEFNVRKSSALEEITKKAKEKSQKQEELKEQNEKVQRDIESLEQDIEKKRHKLKSLKEETKELENGFSDINENPQYQAKVQERKAIQDQIDSLKANVSSAVEEVDEEIKELQSKKSELQVDLSKIEQANKAKERLKELHDQEQVLNQEYEDLERELFLAEKFTRQKVNLLESKINSKFKYARFKLFEEQINGGLKETCETLYKGVPYNTGLNTASQINVGLDIINTLNEYYQVYAPIFIDNAEAVTRVAETESQTIQLLVNEDYPELEIKKLA